MMRRRLVLVLLAGAAAVGGAGPLAAPTATNAGRFPPGKVTVFETATGIVRRTVTVGRYPQLMAVSPNGTQVFVASVNPSTDSGVVTAIDAARGTTRTIRFRGLPVAMAFTPGGKQMYVSVTGGPLSLRTGLGHVDVIQTATDRIVKSIGLNWPGPIVISPDGKTAFVVNADWVNETGAVMVTPIRTSTGTKQRAIRIASYKFHADKFVMAPDGKTAYLLSDNYRSVSSDPGIVTPIRTATRRALRRIKVGNFPFDMAIGPDGWTLWVTGDAGVIPISTDRLIARRAIEVDNYADGMVVTPDSKTVYVIANNVVWPISAATDTAGTPIQLNGRTGPDPNPAAITITPDGRTVYVITSLRTPQGIPGYVATIHATTNTVGGQIQVGVDPTQIAIAPNGKFGYVLDYGK